MYLEYRRPFIERHKKALITISIILVLIVGLFVYTVYELRHWGDDWIRIDRTTEVITSTGRAFTIEYIMRTFPHPEYNAHICLSDPYTGVGSIKLSEMYSKPSSDNLEWTEPNLTEILLFDDMECYVFFEDLLIYFYGDTHGSVRISEISSDRLLPEVIAKFLPVAERIANSETVAAELRNTCELFLNNNKGGENEQRTQNDLVETINFPKLSPSGRYEADISEYDDNRVRCYRLYITDVNKGEKTKYTVDTSFRARDNNFICWADDEDILWGYNGDIGTCFWLLDGEENWTKMSYAENLEAEVPQMLRNFRPEHYK